MSDVKTYRYSVFGKGFFILLGVAVLALSLYRGFQSGTEHVYVGLTTTLLLSVFLIKLFKQKIKLEGKSINVVGRLLPDTSIRYEDITQIRIGDSIDAVQVYASNGWWPDVSVHYGIHDWKGLAIELVERVPPKVEVVDRWGVTADVQQGAKWSGASAQAP